MYCGSRWSYDQTQRANYAQKVQKWKEMKKAKYARFRLPVNILESDTQYELHLHAPGLTKENFTITVVDQILTISIKAKEAKLEENTRWLRKEYAPNGYKRQFELSDLVDVNKIAAKYEAGILKLTVLKKEDSVTTRNDVMVN